MKFILDQKLDKYTWKHYLLQSALAAAALYAAFSIPMIDEPILIAAIGSTSFIVFAMPESSPAKPKNVLGGHLACGLLGLLFFNLHSTL
ncbi:MAG: HPP family protein, partial [Candidatus Saliniplasma sp.]